MLGLNSIILQTEGFGIGIETVILFVAVFLGTTYFLNRRNQKADNQINQKVTKLDPNIYQSVTNIYFTDPEDKIDQIIFSIYGIFVIKHVAVSGNVTGSENDQQWTAKTKWRTKSFDNPIKENQRLTQVLIDKLNLKDKNIYPIVTFSDKAKLNLDQSTIDSHHVISAEQLSKTIEQYQTPQLSKKKISELVEKLEANKKEVK